MPNPEKVPCITLNKQIRDYLRAEIDRLQRIRNPYDRVEIAERSINKDLTKNGLILYYAPREPIKESDARKKRRRIYQREKHRMQNGLTPDKFRPDRIKA